MLGPIAGHHCASITPFVREYTKCGTHFIQKGKSKVGTIASTACSNQRIYGNDGERRKRFGPEREME
jgi:hypothetical protein